MITFSAAQIWAPTVQHALSKFHRLPCFLPLSFTTSCPKKKKNPKLSLSLPRCTVTGWKKAPTTGPAFLMKDLHRRVSMPNWRCRHWINIWRTGAVTIIYRQEFKKKDTGIWNSGKVIVGSLLSILESVSYSLKQVRVSMWNEKSLMNHYSLILCH